MIQRWLLAALMILAACTSRGKPAAVAPNEETQRLPCKWENSVNAVCVSPSSPVLRRLHWAWPYFRDRDDDGPQVVRGSQQLTITLDKKGPPMESTLPTPVSSLLPLDNGGMVASACHKLLYQSTDTAAPMEVELPLPVGAKSIWPAVLLSYSRDTSQLRLHLAAYVGLAGDEKVYELRLYEVVLSGEQAVLSEVTKLPAGQSAETYRALMSTPMCQKNGSRCLRCKKVETYGGSATPDQFIVDELLPSGTYKEVPLYESPLRTLDARWTSDDSRVLVLQQQASDTNFRCSP